MIDEWSGLAKLIEKYVSDLGIDAMSDTKMGNSTECKGNETEK